MKFLLQVIVLILLTFKLHYQVEAISFRLVNGASPIDGYVEVFENQSWLLVCGDYWAGQATEVLCREITFGENFVWIDNITSLANDTTWILDFTCLGDENTLSSCSGVRAKSRNCSSSVYLTCDLLPPFEYESHVPFIEFRPCKRKTCSNYSNKIDQHHCGCDQLCDFFGDCCENIAEVCDIPNLNRTELPDSELLDCVSLPVLPGEAAPTVWMIMKCPFNENRTTLLTNCTKDWWNETQIETSLIQPVIDERRIVYKNKYCAECNGIHEASVEPLKTLHECNNCPDSFSLQPSDIIDQSFDECYVYFEFFYQIRRCDSTLIRGCSQNMDDIILTENCRRFVAPVRVNESKLFKNTDCATCSGVDKLDQVCEPHKAHSAGSVQDVFNVYRPVDKMVQICATDELYRDGLCIKRSYTYLDTCEPRVYLGLELYDKRACHFLKERSKACFVHSLNSLVNYELNLTLSQDNLGINFPLKTKDIIFKLRKKFLSSELRYTLEESLLTFLARAESIQQLCYIRNIYLFDICINTPNTTSCTGGIISSIYNQTHQNNESLGFEMERNNSNVYRAWYSVHNKLLVPEFDIQEDVFICEIPFNFQEKKTPTIPAKDTLSLFYFGKVLSGFAVLFYLATFVTYGIFKPLQNVFGIAFMNFVFSVAIAIVLLEYVNENVSKNTFVCVMFAAIGHYMWLGAFSWMSILSWELRRTFAGQFKSSHQRLSKTTAQYFLVGWGLPLVIIVICFILHVTSRSNLNFRYGAVQNNTLCWIHDQVSATFVVGVPLGCSILFNAIMFVMTVFALTKHRKETAVLSAGKEEDKLRKRTDIIINIKISTIMGLSWTSGFIASGSGLHFLWFLFYFLFAMNGFLVFVFFGFNSRIRKMWADKLGLRSRISSKSDVREEINRGLASKPKQNLMEQSNPEIWIKTKKSDAEEISLSLTQLSSV